LEGERIDIGASEGINRVTGTPELIIHQITRFQSIRSTMKSLATISALVAVALAVPSPHIRKDIRQARLTV
jgi:hypothetical protein